VNEDRVRELLRDRAAPDEAAAQERAWRVFEAALGERAPRRRPRSSRRLAAVLAVLALLAGALTPPGQAVADWLRDVVDRDDNASDALVSLPTEGRLLVTSDRGPWIVDADGSKRLLGAFEDASWSPQGLFVVATRGHEVVALEPGGRPRWSIARAGRVRAPRWSPDGFRIAYHAGGGLRVIAGDGTGDRLVVRSAARTGSAWWPGPAHRLAYVDGAGRVALIDTDAGRVLWRSAPMGTVVKLEWSSDGSRLVAVTPRALHQFGISGRPAGVLRTTGTEQAQTAAFRPRSHDLALVTRDAQGRSRLEVVRVAGGRAQRRWLIGGVSGVGDIAWAPDGEWLLAGLEQSDRWLFLHATDRGTLDDLRAVRNISRQFDPGGVGNARFPGLAGWCCAPVGRPK
jgi:hypothetical protein